MAVARNRKTSREGCIAAIVADRSTTSSKYLLTNPQPLQGPHREFEFLDTSTAPFGETRCRCDSYRSEKCRSTGCLTLGAQCNYDIYKNIYSGFSGGPRNRCKQLRNLVGLPGFEPGTSCTPSKRASQAAPQPESPKITRLEREQRRIEEDI